MITVIIKPSGTRPYTKRIPNTLRALQEEVKGYIECINSPIKDVDIITNDEGKLKGLPPNFYIGWGEYRDIIAGTAVFAVINNETGEYIDMTPKQEKAVYQYLQDVDLASGTEKTQDFCRFKILPMI